ncbi:MAG: O-antigen ligase family protein [Rhodospirillales bacterium]|nr:O-antigen ligase family protein [Rhodospirillales bacterium]
MTLGTARSRPSRPDSPGWLFWPFLCLILAAPAALGANRPVAWSSLALGLGLLLLSWCAAAGRNRSAAPVTLTRLAPAALPFALAVAWALFQAVPWAPETLKDPAWAAAGRALGQPLPAAISFAPEEAATGVMRLLAYGAVLLLGLELGFPACRERAVLWAVALAGALYALYGILVWMDGNHVVLWMEKWTYSDSLTSTFVSRNSYATYAGLGLCACLALIARALTHRAPANALAALLALATLISAALLLTRSRGGVLSAVIVILVMTALLAAGRSARRVRLIFAASAVGLLAAGIGAVGSGVIGRLSPEDVEDFGGRAQIWERATAAVIDRPFGGGLGAFPDFFPAYRDLALGLEFGTLDKAHNLYLELAAELGLPVAGALILGVGWLVARTLLASLRLRPGAALAAAGASSLVGVHSLVDFSLQIPAVTATWLLLLGAGLGQVEREARERRVSRHERLPSS